MSNTLQNIQNITNEDASEVSVLLKMNKKLPFLHDYKTDKEKVIAFFKDKMPLGRSTKLIIQAYELLKSKGYEIFD